MDLGSSVRSGFYWKLFGKSWPKWLGGVLLAVLNIMMFAYIMPIGGVYPAMADWGIWGYRLAGVNIQAPWGTLEPLHLSMRSMVNFGLLTGALTGALFSGEFMIRKASPSACLKSMAGGALMGIGSLLVGSCIVGGFYSSVMALSLSGFYMMAGLIAGGFIGGKLIWNKKPGSGTAPSEKVCKSGCDSHLQKIGVIVLIAAAAIIMVYFMQGMSSIAGVTLFGIGFGFVFQRSSFGFSTAFREIFITKNNETMRGLLISLIAGIAGFSIIKANGIKPLHTFVSPAGWHTLAGGLVFGFGMVMADG